jgi:predicted Zn-dependent peptidase
MFKTNVFNVNGVRVLHIKNSSPVSFVGIAVKNGSNYEKPHQEGLSHFCEHMFFKGTEKRNYEQINQEFALIGADPNAYTSNTFVMYHLTLPKKNVSKAFDLLSDMFFNSQFEQSEIEKEKTVINEEINMYDDNPICWFSDYVGKTVFNRSIGHPVIGNKNVVNSVTSKKIKAYLNSTINIRNIMVVIAGNHTEKELAKIISDNLPVNHEYLKGGSINAYNGKMWKNGLDFSQPIFVENVNASQGAANIIYPYYPDGHKSHLVSKVLINVIGGGMYSYMFNEIREKLGLAYATGAYRYEMEYGKIDALSLYAYLDSKNIDLFFDSVDKMFNMISKEGIDKNIFKCAKMSLISNVAKNSETSEGLARNYKAFFEGESDMNDKLKQIEKIKIEDCNILLKETIEQKNIKIYMKSTKNA